MVLNWTGHEINPEPNTAAIGLFFNFIYVCFCYKVKTRLELKMLYYVKSTFIKSIGFDDLKKNIVLPDWT